MFSNRKGAIINGLVGKAIEWLAIAIIAIVGFVFTIQNSAKDLTELKVDMKTEVKPKLQELELRVAKTETQYTFIAEGIKEIKEAVINKGENTRR